MRTMAVWLLLLLFVIGIVIACLLLLALQNQNRWHVKKLFVFWGHQQRRDQMEAWNALFKAHPHLHKLFQQHCDDSGFKSTILDLLETRKIDVWVEKVQSLQAAHPDFARHIDYLWKRNDLYHIWNQFAAHRMMAKQLCEKMFAS